MRPRLCFCITGATALMAVHRAGEVHVDDLRPFLGGQPVEVLERDRLVVGGVVDEDVEAAEALHHLVDEPLHLRRLRHIALERLRPRRRACAIRPRPRRPRWRSARRRPRCSRLPSPARGRCAGPSPPLPPVTTATAPFNSMMSPDDARLRCLRAGISTRSAGAQGQLLEDGFELVPIRIAHEGRVVGRAHSVGAGPARPRRSRPSRSASAWKRSTASWLGAINAR